MGHYARVTDGIVTSVIVAEADFFDTFIDDTAGEWIKTSYNTYGGVHSSGGTPLRKNYASVGYHYDSEADAFYAPQPYPSWTLNKSTYIWESNIPYPDDNSTAYEWNESSLSWVQVAL
jgi:hypothetical protein